MKRLSVVIPMYNVEPYVERCIRSLLQQDLPLNDYEIICVNDGSPDRSGEIVERLQKEYSNIILINQQNQGVSRARNRGIHEAGSKYVLFIDPDDYIRQNTLNMVLKNAESKNAQVSFLGFTFLNSDGSVRQEVLNNNLDLFITDGIEAYFLTRKGNPPDPDRMWAVLFETEFFKSFGLNYLPDVPFLEDGELIARILSVADRCIFDSMPFYLRTTRLGSATNSKLFHTEKAARGFLASAHNLKKFQSRESLSPRQKTFLNQPICKFVILTMTSSIRKPYLRTFRETRAILQEFGLGRLNTNKVVRPYLYFGFVYNQLPFLFLFRSVLHGWKSGIKAIFKLKEY
jgi:glycosyltransferase involved in cell wall biosynthesis